MRRGLALVATICFLALPITVTAETTSDTQNQLIVALQQLIQLLTTELAQLEQQVGQSSNSSQPVTQCPMYTATECSSTVVPQGYDQHGCAISPKCTSPLVTITPHTCNPMTPPSCSTTLTPFYDTYNCVTGYACAAPAVNPPPTNPVGTTDPASDANCKRWRYCGGPTCTRSVPGATPQCGSDYSNEVCTSHPPLCTYFTSSASCTMYGQPFESGTVLKIRTCADDHSLPCTGTIAVASYYCANGTVQMCNLGSGTNYPCPANAPVALTNK